MIINKYFPGEPVYIYTIINKYFAGEKLGNYRQKRVRVNFHYFVITENGLSHLCREDNTSIPK